MTDLLLRLFAEDAGRWNRVELHLRELGRPWPVLLVGAVALGLLVHWVLLARAGRGVPRLRLALLRALAAAMVLLVVLGPALELQRASRIPSRVAVLVDASRSMALAEGGGTRLDRVREALAPALAALGKRFEVELFAFDERLRPLPPDAVAALAPDGRRSDLARALAELAPGRGGAVDEGAGELAGIVLFTDGADTERLRTPEDVARRRPEWPIAPVFPVLAGDPGALLDVALTDLRHEKFGFARHPLSFEVKVAARNAAGKRVEITLAQDGAPIATRSVVPRREREEIPLRFDLTPEKPGTYLYRLAARPLPGEAVLDNNVVEFAVQVSRDQLRVLLICGRPSWDERFLRQLLKQDPGVDLVSFFILRDTEDTPGVPQDELSLIPFPVNDLFTTELESFDVVVLQNFDRRAFLSNLHLDNLREFVSGKGGGLLLVGGDLGFSAGGYAGTPLEEVLPFRLDAPEVADEAPFGPRLTPAGETHFITRLEPEAEANRALYAALPPLDGTNVVGGLQADSVALLAHPVRAGGGGPMPVLAARAAGKGRSLALTADSSWYWSFKRVGAGGTNREYVRFWQNALRWLSQDPTAKFLRVSLGADAIEPGEAQSVRVRALKGDYAPLAGARVRVEVLRASGGSAGKAAAPERHEGATGENGVLRVESVPGGEGFWRARAELVDPQGRVVDRDERLFEVRADRTETALPELRPDLLEAIARATGGRVLAPAEAGRPPIEEREAYRLAERRRLELWDNGAVYGLLLAALALEWWMRRRAGLA